MCAEPQFCLVFEAIRLLGAFHQQELVSSVSTSLDILGLQSALPGDDVGVEGFPTIKFGDPANLEDYEGEREFDDLAKFAKDNLGPRCHGENCSQWSLYPIYDFYGGNDRLYSATQILDSLQRAYLWWGYLNDRFQV